MTFDHSIGIAKLQQSSTSELQGDDAVATQAQYYLVREKSPTRVYPLSNLDQRIVGAFFIPVVNGRPLTAEVLAAKPDPYIVQSTIKKDQPLPAVFGGGSGFIPWHLNLEAKHVFESLDPGIHDFLSVKVRREGAEEDDGVYYLLHETSAIEAVVIEETDFSDGRGQKACDRSSSINVLGQIVLDRSKIQGRQFWRASTADRKFGPINMLARTYFCSEEFRKRMRALKNARFEFIECIVKPA